MEIVKANLSHFKAFEQYVEKCALAGMEMYIIAQSDSEALLKKRIGYAKGKGIATFMLNWVKFEVTEDSAIVTCDVNNTASRRVIEKAGGEFLNTFYSEQDQYEVRRYRLSVE
ncbi:GNAT family N-acetyltransferase [Vibrio harveyi]|uniref:GNAT family N-acetyltransferase n=1 Tax=Vibrio harveyi TaxID=669 RepID=UPI004068E33D